MSENWSDYVGYAASVFVILSFMLKDIKDMNIYNKKIPVDIINLFSNIKVKEKRKRMLFV